MKRLDFMKTMAISAIGISVLPFWMVKSNADKKILPFPEAQNQTRHAGLNQVMRDFDQRKTQVLNYERLYKNGISSSTDDLLIFDLTFKNKRIVVQHSGLGTSISMDRDLTTLSTGINRIGEISAELFYGKFISSQTSLERHLVLPLNHYLIDHGKSIYQSAIVAKHAELKGISAPLTDSLTLVLS